MTGSGITARTQHFREEPKPMSVMTIIFGVIIAAAIVFAIGRAINERR